MLTVQCCVLRVSFQDQRGGPGTLNAACRSCMFAEWVRFRMATPASLLVAVQYWERVSCIWQCDFLDGHQRVLAVGSIVPARKCQLEPHRSTLRSGMVSTARVFFKMKMPNQPVGQMSPQHPSTFAELLCGFGCPCSLLGSSTAYFRIRRDMRVPVCLVTSFFTGGASQLRDDAPLVVTIPRIGPQSI